MFVTVNGARVHALTGGAAFDPTLPAMVFLHGAGMDATIWALQSRWFAHHGHSVLALDFPAHGRSEGPPLTTIDAMAAWVGDVLTTCDVSGATVVGHSMGSLVALAAAAALPDRISRLVLIGTALEMKVGPDLLEAAAANDPAALAMVNLWGHGPRAVLGGSEMPGLCMEGTGRRLLQQSPAGSLGADLAACNSFRPADVAPSVEQPTLICQGRRDLMTPTKAAKALAARLRQCDLDDFDGAGHMLMVEEAGKLLDSLAAFCAEGRLAAKTATQPVGAPP